MDQNTCCACSSEGTARVVDGGYTKPVCGQHARKYAREGYTVLPRLPLSTES